MEDSFPTAARSSTFSDYCRNALRMAALMRVRSLFVFTHDSIGLGEDGPTHQPIEHLAALRLIPNMDVWRPCDTVEIARRVGARPIERTDGPDEPGIQPPESAVPVAQRRGRAGHSLAAAMCWWSLSSAPRAVIIATGSEVAARRRSAEGARARWHSGACRVHAFDDGVRSSGSRVIAIAFCRPTLPCVAVEAGVPDLWRKYVGRSGAVIGIDRFGESAPAGDLFRHFGFVSERVVEAVMISLLRSSP